MTEDQLTPTVKIVHRSPLATRIRQARTKAKLSQVRLGEEIGASQSAVADYETGRTEPNIATLERIAEVCSVLIPWLVTGIGDPYEHQKIGEKQSSLNRFESNDWVMSELFSKLDDMFKSEGLYFSMDVVSIAARRIRKAVFSGAVDFGEPAFAKINLEVQKERTRVQEWKSELILEILTTGA